MSSSWVLPDGPLNFFLLGTALLLAPIAEGEDLPLRTWVLAGLLTGLAALSKYHAIFFAGSFFLYLVSTPHGRAVLRKPGVWVAAAVALAVFSPVLLWNAQHGWVSFLFQGERAQSHRLGTGIFLSLLAQQIGLLLPWTLLPLGGGIARAFSHGDSRSRFVLWLGLPIALFLSLVPLWSGGGMVQWAMPGWLLLMPLAGKFLSEKTARFGRRWIVLSTAGFLVSVALTCAEMQTGWLGNTFPHIFRLGDPTAENVEWSKLSLVINKFNAIDKERAFVLTSGWRDASKIDHGLGGHYRVGDISDDPRNFAMIFEPSKFQHRNGWIALKPRAAASTRTAMARCFSKIQKASRITIARGLLPDAHFDIWRGDDFLADRCKMKTVRDFGVAPRSPGD